MYLKDFVYGLCILIIPLILILLLHRLYIGYKCHNNKECIKKKMIIDIDEITNKLQNNVNYVVNDSNDEKQSEEQVEEEIEGFFGGLTDWIYGKTSGAPLEQNQASPTNTLSPSPDILKATNNINDAVPQLNSKFPNENINDTSNKDLLDSISKKNNTLKDITSKKLNSSNPIDNVKNLNNDLKNEIHKSKNNSTLKENISNKVLPNDTNIIKEKIITNTKNESKLKPVIEKKEPKLSNLFNKCNFYSDKCPKGYNDFGSIGLSGIDKNVMLSCGNVENTKPAKAIAKIKNNALDEIIILDKGHGFNPQNPPKISVVGGKGNGGECESVVDDNGYLSLIKIKHPGNFYTETPNIIIEPPLMNSNCHFCCK